MGFFFEEMATSAEMQALLASVGQQQQLPLAVAAGRTYGRTSLPTQHSPQSRARILLQDMASLTDRLVKVAGDRKGWQQAGHVKTTLPSLLSGETVAPPEGAAATTKEILSLLESHQFLLFEAVAELGGMQEPGQLDKQQIGGGGGGTGSNNKGSALRAFAKRVRDAEQVLESTLEDMAEFKSARLGTSMDVQELVSYAHRVSYTTFAPPEYASGLVPLRGALPPAPQDGQMRASLLYQAHELDLGLPKSTAPALSPLVPTDGAGQMAVEASGPAHLEPPPVPAVPAGWQPGMPVQLPTELPPMPIGWKIGDPIPLPPGLDMTTFPPGWKARDVSQGPASLRPKAPPAPALIHVPHVQLDLNPELEEDLSSEYGSESNSDEDND